MLTKEVGFAVRAIDPKPPHRDRPPDLGGAVVRVNDGFMLLLRHQLAVSALDQFGGFSGEHFAPSFP
jgi:hypothetical protein